MQKNSKLRPSSPNDLNEHGGLVRHMHCNVVFGAMVHCGALFVPHDTILFVSLPVISMDMPSVAFERGQMYDSKIGRLRVLSVNGTATLH